MTHILFILGFVLLIGGANWLIEGASSIGRKYKIPDIVIGLTIVSFGTSLPELIISLFASAQSSTDLAVSNVLGSNIFNVFVIVGISAIISPIVVGSNTTWKEIPYSLLAALLLGLTANDLFFDGRVFNEISRIDGMIFLAFFIIFIYYTYNVSKTGALLGEEHHDILPMWKSYMMIGAGLVGLYLGGQWIVSGAVDIASSMGMNENILGLTIIATGTSLPELVTSVVAALKKNSDIAIGNALGSNIFNIFLVLGVSATVTPLPFNADMMSSEIMAILSNVLLFVFIFTGKGRKISRFEGVLLLTIYILFITYQIIKYI
ncbi:MAG: calcium/sodium antiporter [Bacteroidales bacterium]|nr:calcium/sodium antiporter [Bacteroidales bacterium]